MLDDREKAGDSNKKEAGQTETSSSQSLAGPPTISLPKGGGAIRGMGEKFAANPVTGTGSMSVPLATSPGRSGFGPQLSLSYDSGAGNGPFGLGWNLSLPSITRKTDKGLPRYQDAHDSDVFILSGAEDLVPEFKKNKTGEWVKADGNFVREEVLRDGYLVRRYRPRIEGLFARIERWTSQTEPTDVFWRSISRDNVTTLYGQTEKSRIADPSDGSKIFSWLICESYDDKGNAIRYEYETENSDEVDFSASEKNRSRSAQRYLKRIKYCNKTPRTPKEILSQRTDWLFEVVFDYGEHYPDDPKPKDNEELDQNGKKKNKRLCRHDPFSTYRSGFEVRTYRLCQRVLMFHHFPEEDIGSECLVKSTDFVYRNTRGDATDLRQGHPNGSFIASVSHSGYKSKAGGGYLKKSLPPLEFTYSEAVINEDVQEVDAESLDNLPYGLDGSRYQWVDLDGEGLSGILTEQGGAWFYKRNLSALPVSTDNGTRTIKVRFAPVECLPTMPSPANLSSGQQLLDLAGDGQLDVVEFDGPVPGFFERTPDEGWETFRSFASLPNVAWKDPNLKFVDLTGDGHADILVTEDEVLTWYPSLAEEGFGPAEKVRQAFDEETGPRLVFADGTQSIYLSDFSGDGLIDLIRIRNGEVCYWPNLGYGRFGAKVTMDHAPWFDAPDQFDQKRIRLADIDGSGTIDILYLGRDGVHLYFNRSGNSWSAARKLKNFLRVDNLSSVMTVDLLGNGTACLVWSSPLPADARRPMRYIDLMGGLKPHLLVKTINNLGAETKVDYAPSTKFYLADKYAGRPWITKLPFPVHCVEKVTVTDKWRDTKFSTTYSYHHGYFDGIEREFRGFGRVEQVDVESFGEFQAGNVDSPYITKDRTLYQPPVKTITWFHTGAALDRRRILTQFQTEYFPNSLAALPGYSAVLAGFNEKPLPEPDLESQDLSAEEWREALRACKGMTLRQEIYELDVDQLEAGKQIPVWLFSAATHNCNIRRLQASGENRHAVFLVTESEAISYNYELDLRQVTFPPDPKNILPLEPDPRVAHTLNLTFDEYGNIQQSIAVGYKRAKLSADSDLTVQHLDLIRAVQAEQHLAYSETRYTDDAIAPPAGASLIQQYRLRMPCEVQTYELIGIEPSPGKFYFELADFRHYVLSKRYPALTPTKPVAPKQYHERPQEGVATMRLVEHARTLFFDDNPTGPDAANRFLKEPLPLGTLGKLGLPYEQYKLALTEQLLSAVFTNGQLNAVVPSDGTSPKTVRDKLNHWQTSGYLSGTDATDKFGPGAAGQYWMRSGIAGFAPDAAQHFYLPERYTDAFSNITTLQYDPRDLFIQSSRDALGNTSGVLVDPATGKARFDYRVLAPLEMVDPNGNHSEVRFDVLGLVVAATVKGKQINGHWEGDHLDDLTEAIANPPAADVVAFCTLDTLDKQQARDWLASASVRFVYHFGDESGLWSQRMAGACAIAREQHVGQLSTGKESPLQVSLECSDGIGNVLMKKVQAEPDPNSTATDPPLRWIINGLTVLSNKGKPVKQYEPAFSPDFGCELPQANGVTPVMYYDAAGRLVRTELPDGSLSRVEFTPWQVLSYDPNDTAYDPDPTKRSDWYNRRTDPAHPRFVEFNNAPDRRAADLVEMHANTPSVTYLDSLGRNVVSVAHNKYKDRQGTLHDERYVTFTKLDAEGKPLWIRDARGNLVMQYITPIKPTRAVDEPNQTKIEAMPANSVPCYDIAGNLLFQHSMDAGDRWMINDAAGKPMFAWDFNQRQDATNAFIDEQRLYSTHYDPLHRPTKQWLTINVAPPQMVERFDYVDTGHLTPLANITDAQDRNLCGQLYRHYDPSGRIQVERIDFKGSPLEVQRRLVSDHTTSVTDWQTVQNSKLETETFIQITEYDALKRMTRLYNWHRGIGSRVAVYEPRYNERGLLLSEQLVVQANRNSATSGKRYDEVPGVTQRNEAIKEIRHDAKGQRQFLKLGSGTITHYDYDPFTFRLRQLRTTRLTSGQADPAFPVFASNLTDPRVLQQLHYTYDPVGNITEIYDEAYEPVFFKNQEVEPRSRYTYDALYRLVEATGREGFHPANAPTRKEPVAQEVTFAVTDKTLREYTQRYTYDPVGNIERMQHTADQGDWDRRYQYALGCNRLLHTWEGDDSWNSSNARNKTTYHYDTHGNMRNLLDVAEEHYLRWDHRDMIGTLNLGGGGKAYYQYDAGKQRTRKRLVRNSGGIVEDRIYLGGLEWYRRTLNGALVEEIETLHLFDGEQRLLMVDQVIETNRPALGKRNLYRYTLSNHLGSSTVEVDENADIISFEEYHPYGTTAYQSGRNTAEVKLKRYRYTGMERDEESGLSYHKMRYYCTWLGRWASIDPLKLDLQYSLYCYAPANPLVTLDRDGRHPLPAPAQALADQATARLSGSTGKLEQGSFLTVVFEAQAGRFIKPSDATFTLHGTSVAEHLVGARNDIAAIDTYLRNVETLSSEGRGQLAGLRDQLQARVNLGEQVQRAAATLGQNPSFQKRLEGVVLNPKSGGKGALVTEQLRRYAQVTGRPELAELLPPNSAQFEEFQGLLRAIEKGAPVRPVEPTPGLRMSLGPGAVGGRGGQSVNAATAVLMLLGKPISDFVYGGLGLDLEAREKFVNFEMIAEHYAALNRQRTKRLGVQVARGNAFLKGISVEEAMEGQDQSMQGDDRPAWRAANPDSDSVSLERLKELADQPQSVWEEFKSMMGLPLY